MKKRKETLAERIKRERRELNLRPWQYAPSEVDDGPAPYQPGCAGHEAWKEAQAMRAQIKQRDPHYFG